ncbi:MAG: hypothetical protein ABI954_06045 [Pyrinomonadaceae bacterium]
MLFLILIVGGDLAKSQNVPKISDGDKFQIIKSILSKEFQGSVAKTICLSTENIPKSVLKQFPDVDNVKLTLSAPDKIGEVLGCGDYSYFSRFEKKGSSILVYFTSKYRDVSSSGRRFSYRKAKGKWHGRIVGFSMSNS